MTAHQGLTTGPVLEAELTTVRGGTEFFGRKLDEVSDAELDGDSLLPEWTRRHVVAHIGYNARAIARLIEWAGTGVETPMYESAEARNNEIAHGVALVPFELRDLYNLSAMQLHEAWRELPAMSWSHLVKAALGRIVPASETVWMRTREVWVYGVDLNNGASFDDIPVDVLERILGDITRAWKARGDDKGLQLEVSGAQACSFGDRDAAVAEIVSGSLADVTAWACGRGSDGVTSSRRDSPVAPRWI